MRALLRNIDLGTSICSYNSVKTIFHKVLSLTITFSSIFLDKSGLVKEDAFFTILKLHGMALSDAEKNRLKKNYSRANKINFSEALTAINIDLDSAVLNEEKWTVQQNSGKA